MSAKYRIFIVLLISAIVLPCIAEARSFVAYSMNVAENRLKGAGHSNDELQKLGNMSRIAGMVYDEKNRDLIIVGQVTAEEQEIKLDDFVTALRSVLVHKKYPLVSIDRTEETAETGKQKVYFEGGINNTGYGQHLLEADILLKKLALGLLPTELWGVESYFSMSLDQIRDIHSDKEDQVQSRFWFYPIKPSLAIREDVFAIRDLEIGVKTEVMYAQINGESIDDLSSVRDTVGDEFARRITTNFDDLRVSYPELARLKTLLDLVAIAKGIDELKLESDINYWLDDYELSEVTTPEQYELLKREEKVKIKNKYKFMLEVSGGIDLDPIILRLQAGDVTALRDAVINSRPDRNTLTWRVPLEGWTIPGSPDEDSYDERDLFASKDRNGFSLNRKVHAAGSQGIDPTMKTYNSINAHSVKMPSVSTYSSLIPKRHESVRVGGVMLQGAAKTAGGESAEVDLTSGKFSLIVGGENARLAPKMYRKFITALWAVYYSNRDPGISIDPIAPGIDRHLVRYIGRVVNSDLGRVMREADYLMKKWSVGTERPDMHDFRNPDEYAAERGRVYLAPSRFWFYPEDMRFKRSNDMLLFDRGRMTLKTEYLVDGPDIRADPSNEQFARYFTDNYREIASKYPVYAELFEYAKMVSLAKYLKDRGVPLYWFLMANKDLVITENSPGTVDELVRDSDYFRGIRIKGGVDLAFDVNNNGNYVYDQETVDAITEALVKYSEAFDTSGSVSFDNMIAHSGSHPVSFNVGNKSYTVVPQHSLTSGKDMRGNRYQTDIAVRGTGFQLTDKSLDQIKSTLVYRETIKAINPLLKSAGKDKLDAEEISAIYRVKQNKAEKKVDAMLAPLNSIKNRKYADEAEFVSDIKTLLGKEQSERLKRLIVKEAYYVNNLELVRYFRPGQTRTGEFGDGWHILLPYRIRQYGSARTEFLNIVIPEKMAVENLLTGEKYVMTFDTDKSAYEPDDPEVCGLDKLVIMSDATYRLSDKIKNEFWFDHTGHLTDMVFSGDHHIHIEYLLSFTDRFDQSPYRIEPADKEKVDFLNISLPKTMTVKNLVHGYSETLEFDGEKDIAGYYPVKADASRFRMIAVMSDTSFRLLDSNGNESAFNPSGEFEGMAVSSEHRMVRSISQGNQKIDFDYTVDKNGKVLIAHAGLSDSEGGGVPTYLVKYNYDEDGRLHSVTNSDVKTAKLQNDEDHLLAAVK